MRCYAADVRKRSGNKLPQRLPLDTSNSDSGSSTRGAAAGGGAEEEDDSPVWRGPSRSQKKRDASRIYDLGVLLSNLKLPQLKRLPIDEELLEAVVLVGQMKRTAQARQLRRVAKLLRDCELQPLVNALREAGFD